MGVYWFTMSKYVSLLILLFGKSLHNNRQESTRILNFKKYRPTKPMWSSLNNGNGFVSWKPPKRWMQSPDYVLVLELIPNKANTEEKENPYGATQEWRTYKKQFSHADKDGIIRIEIGKDILKKHKIAKVKVKILNTDYESSQYSNEVLIGETAKTRTISNKRQESRSIKKQIAGNITNATEQNFTKISSSAIATTKSTATITTTTTTVTTTTTATRTTTITTTITAAAATTTTITTTTT